MHYGQVYGFIIKIYHCSASANVISVERMVSIKFQ